MSLEDGNCRDPIDHCDYAKLIYSQFSDKPRMNQIFCATMEKIACDANAYDPCGKVGCDEATGDLLTLWGQRAGFPRRHCAVKVSEAVFGLPCPDPLPPAGTGCPETEVVGLCEGGQFRCGLVERSDYIFEDDEFYRPFVKAGLIKRRLLRNKKVPDVNDVREMIQALWGPDAWVVYSQGGAIGVSAGRDLTPEEICLLAVYGKVICVGIGIQLDIFCVEPPGPCDVICPEIPDITKTSGSFLSYTSPPFTNAAAINEISGIGIPPWMTFVVTQGPSGPFFTISGTSPAGASSFTLIFQGVPTLPEASPCAIKVEITCLEAPAFECPADDIIISCEDDLPYTLSGFVGAASISGGSASYSVAANAGLTDVVISGTSTVLETVVITATNGTDSCSVNVTIESCADVADDPSCPAGLQLLTVGTPVGGLISGTPNTGTPSSGAITVTNSEGESCSFGYQFSGMEN